MLESWDIRNIRKRATATCVLMSIKFSEVGFVLDSLYDNTCVTYVLTTA